MKQISDTQLFLFNAMSALLACLVLTLFLDFSVTNSVIVVHVMLGGLAFLIGNVTIFSKKGSSLHIITGRLFYTSMVVSVALTLVVSLLPKHLSPSLFQIGVLSLYFLIGGKRSVEFKRATQRPLSERLMVDRALAYIVVSVSLLVMFYSVVLEGYFYPLRTVFGSVGILFGLVDLMLFRQPQNIKRKWLLLHLSKMLGGYTAAVTAFFVAQDLLSGYYNWFLPTVFALGYILYWMFKLKAFKPALAQ